MGYDLDHEYLTNIYSTRSTYEAINTSNIAFMDDTTWIAESKNYMEEILTIADDFYTLNSIKVNKDKSVLLKYEPDKADDNSHIDLSFGNEVILIRPNAYKESTRFLGIWINLASDRRFIIEQAKDEVTQFCTTLKTKRITDKQLLYLWNMIVIPRIEYRTQVTHLTSRECSHITSIFQKFFKHKVKLSWTAPNAILENHHIYNFRDLYEVQVLSKITNFFIQINDTGLLEKITNIHLKQIQTQEWLVHSPLVD